MRSTQNTNAKELPGNLQSAFSNAGIRLGTIVKTATMVIRPAALRIAKRTMGTYAMEVWVPFQGARTHTSRQLQPRVVTVLEMIRRSATMETEQGALSFVCLILDSNVMAMWEVLPSAFVKQFLLALVETKLLIRANSAITVIG